MSTPYPTITHDKAFTSDPGRNLPRALPPSSRPASPGPNPNPIHDISRPGTPVPPGVPAIQNIVTGQPLSAPKTHAEKLKRARTRAQHAQVTIDRFWDRFTAPHPGKTFTVLPNNAHAKHAQRPGVQGDVKNVLASYAEARAVCEAKVRKIVHECERLNIKYRDPHFDIEDDFRRWIGQERPYADCLMGLNEIRTDLRPMSVKRVEDIFTQPQFFIDGASASDVRQGKEGDCWFMSALCTLSNKEDLVQKVCVAKNEKVGVYGFVFHRDGEWISSVIDDKLYLIKEDFDDSTLERNRWLELQNRVMPADEWKSVMQTGSRALYFAQCSNQNETWLPLLEKAYAKAHGDYSALESGFVGEGIEDLTGGVTTELFSTDILDKDKFWYEELMQVNKQFLFGCGQMNGAYGQRSGIIEKHAYSIMEAREVNGLRLVKLRNPWGAGGEWQGPWADGSAEWTAEWMNLLNHKFGDDGVFWISYQDLLRNYQHFDRTRLFGPEWTTTQQWTAVDVPWSVGYLSTKFKVSVPQAGPVVIILSQLDDRYFRGLEGQYDFHLQFRLHKDELQDYIVRSNAAYYMKRSVSTELTLEPGVYWVLLRIIAKRYQDTPTVADVVAKTSQMRREKLLSVGLSYDMAHAKGNFREVEAQRALAVKEAKKQQRKILAKKMYKARTKERKKSKLRAIRRDQLKQEKMMKRMAEEAEYRARAEAAAEAARKIEEMSHHQSLPHSGTDHYNSSYPSSTNGNTSNITNTAPTRSPPPIMPTRPRRRETLSVHPAQPSPSRHQSFPSSMNSSATMYTPDIRVQRPSISVGGRLTLADMSDDELSWDSELDAPDSLSDSDMVGSGAGGDSEDADDEDGVADPWNAVCVVGLRVFSPHDGVTIEVVQEDEVRPRVDEEEEDDDNAMNTETATQGWRMLDVDDSARDAVSGRTPVNSPVMSREVTNLENMVKGMGLN